MIQDILLQNSYVLKNRISKSDSNKQILAPNDCNKQNFLCSNLMSWLGLLESDNIKQMITLTLITLIGAYCLLSSISISSSSSSSSLLLQIYFMWEEQLVDPPIPCITSVIAILS